MVKTVTGNEHSVINKKLTKEMIDKIFGKTLVIQRVTEVLDSFGQLISRDTSNTSFTGDLQYGLDLDPRFLTTGLVEVGDAVLYIHPEALSVLPLPQDFIVDGNTKWIVISRVEAPELGGDTCHLSYRCKRRNDRE